MEDKIKYLLVRYYFFSRLNWENQRLEEFYFPKIVPYEVLREALEDTTDRLMDEFGLTPPPSI